jgi:hypothetical protein
MNKNIMKEKKIFIQVMNYRIVNNVARTMGTIYVKLTDILLIVGVRVTVDGKSDTLFNVSNNSGIICTINKETLEALVPQLTPMEVSISTYTIINGVSKLNDTRYCNYSTINKITPIKSNVGPLYECTSTLNTTFFNTDELGFQTILKG